MRALFIKTLVWQVLNGEAHHHDERGRMRDKHGFVIMVKEKWWREFQRLHHKGKQVQAYVQKGQAPPKEGALLFFYVTKPAGELAGYAEIIERKVGKAEELWKEHGHESVLSSEKQYLEFIEGHEKTSFIRFKNLQTVSKSIPLNNLRLLLGVKRLSRRGFYVDEETAKKLISVME